MAKKLLFYLFIFTTCIKGFSQDDPCTAVALPLSPVGSCSYIVGDNTGATDSDLTNPNIDAPSGCEPVSANYNGADVWFYIDLGPTTTSLQIDLTHIATSNFDDGVAALYTGTCGGNLTIVECDDDSGSGSLEANFSVVDVLTPNTRVYIRVWEWGGFDEGTFNICASEVENPCDNITNINTCGTTPINATIASGFGAFNDSSCFDVPGDEAVYSFTPTVTGDYTITQTSTFDHINYLYQTSCAATGWTCIDDLAGNNITSSSFSMTSGTTYYIMLDSENSSGGNVSFTLNCPIPPPECGDTFYDTGGPSGDYSNNELETTTIFPITPGDAVTATFTFFETENTYDFLFIYDGPNDTFPLIGTYTGTNNPGTVTSTDASGALTFVFVSDSSITDGGWAADITCAPYVPPAVCGSTFTDSGGTGGNYSNSENTTTTLTPDIPSTNLVATFTSFETENNFDFLYIYDGSNDTFPLIGTYTGTNSPGTVTSTDPSGALTFVFTSDSSVTDPGWVADITCVSTCNLIITDTNYPLGADDCNLDYTELTTNAPPPPPTNTIFSENFDAAGFPSGWTTVNGGTGTTWIISNTTNAGGTANEAMLEWVSGFDDSTWTLTSPMIDITGETNLQLNYLNELDHFSSTYLYSIYVETSTDNTNWTIRYSSINNSTDIPATTNNHDISSHDGNTSLYIRFRFTGEAFGFFDWSIDNIEVLADGTPQPPQVTWSPANGLYTDAGLTTPYVLGNFAGTVYAAPNGTQVYTAEYPVGCTDDVTVTFNKKIWNGTPGNIDWNTATNWLPNGIPTTSNCIVIADTGGNDPIIDSATDGFGYTLLVESGATLTQQPNSTLTIENEVIVNEGGTYNMLDSSSLIQVDNVANTVNGTFTMDRNTNIRANDYVYWSSPVASFNIQNVSPGTPNGYKHEWLPTLFQGVGPPGNMVFGEWQGYDSGAMDVGKGYIVKGPTGHTTTPSNYTATFSGNPNNGNIIQPIERGNHTTGTYFYQPYSGGDVLTITKDDDNWNLIGNPYPSAIDAIDFLTHTNNGNINGSVYLWTHGTDIGTGNTDPFYEDYLYNYNVADYVAYNSSGTSTPSGFNGNIGAGQGFFVLMTDAATTNETVTFDNSMRSSAYSNNQFYRNSNSSQTDDSSANRIWLDFVSPSGQTNTTLVAYIDGATNSTDRMFDAPTTTGNGLNLYSLIDGETYLIQGRQLPFDINDQIPIGLNITETGIQTIAINTLEGLFNNSDQDIFIEDLFYNIVHNIKESPYIFESDLGYINDRFILRYTNTTLGVEDINPLDGIRVFEENETIIVKSDYENIQSIEVYDILGRNLFANKSINADRFYINSIKPSEQTLFLKIKLTNGGHKIEKIIF